MDSPPKNESIQQYLDTLCAWLNPMPPAERDEARQEVCQHLVSLVVAEQQNGLGRDEAIAAAIHIYYPNRLMLRAYGIVCFVPILVVSLSSHFLISRPLNLNSIPFKVTAAIAMTFLMQKSAPIPSVASCIIKGKQVRQNEPEGREQHGTQFNRPTD